MNYSLTFKNASAWVVSPPLKITVTMETYFPNIFSKHF